MTTLALRCILLVGLPFTAGVVSARTDIPWDGVYFGGNVGDASSSTCNSGALKGTAIDPAIASANFGGCSKGGAPVGGVQVGENFQSGRLVWGLGADLDFWSAKTLHQSVKNAGAVPPAGTYAYSSKQSPSGFAVIGPRIGYAGNLWMPYVKAGAIIAIGSHGDTLFYTPTAAKLPSASFGGGKDFSTAGWAAGGGFELGLNGAWSITAEYLHANLGKGSNSSTNCGGTAAACAAFSGITFDNSHAGFSANIFRVGITYWFGYW